jgi:purine-nucleoside phosphorylase
MPTPHINAQPGDFAETVIMPGDPLRAQFISETWLTDARQVNAVRNMFGYTGFHKGKRVSVMAHGMGIPSCSIYATELIKDFGVKNIIRVGSCGALAKDVKLGDVIIAMGACTDSSRNCENAWYEGARGQCIFQRSFLYAANAIIRCARKNECYWC